MTLAHYFLPKSGALSRKVDEDGAYISGGFQPDVKVELNPERLEQELLLLTQKYDVSEEMDRLETHISEVRRILDQKEPVGRRLDFLMQELNREANTLGSKAAHYDCTTASVELKVLIEQMREQIQNIE